MTKTPFRSLWWAVNLQLKNSKLFLMWTVLYSIYNGISSIITIYAGAKFLTAVTAIAFKKASPQEAYMWLIIVLALQLIMSLLSALNGLFERRFQQKMELRVNEVLINKMYELSQEQFDNQEFNTTLSRARDSLFSMWRVVPDLSSLVSAVVQFVGAVVTILLVAPAIGVVISFAVIIVGAVRAWQNRQDEAMYKKLEPYNRVTYRTRWMLIDPNVMPEVRLMNAFSRLLMSWTKSLKTSQDLHFNHEKKQLPVELGSQVIDPLISVGATFYFLQLLIAGLITLDRFIFLRGLIGQASSASSMIATTFQRLHQTSVEMNSFIEINDMQPALPDGTQKVSSPLTIEFKHVSFTYPGAAKPSLEDVSFVINPGSRLALVGENGAGKTTLIKLLLRQYVPSSGKILVNGIPIQQLEQNAYYRQISNLSQDFLMINHLSIHDNLLLGLADDVDEAIIYGSLKLAGAEGFVRDLPNKLNQRLDPSFDDGTGLSGGQKQRLGVARALLRNGDLMILDEPTSAIDAKAEYSIFNNIYKHHANKTTLIVSHRFSTVRKAEKIIVMEHGKIIEYGSHKELMDYNGVYKEMFETQAEGYK